MSDYYICITCNVNCYFSKDEYDEYNGVLCPCMRRYTVLEPEEEEEEEADE